MTYFNTTGGSWVVGQAQGPGGILPDEHGDALIVHTNAAITMTPYEIDQDVTSWIGHAPNNISDPNTDIARIFCSTESLTKMGLR